MRQVCLPQKSFEADTVSFGTCLSRYILPECPVSWWKPIIYPAIFRGAKHEHFAHSSLQHNKQLKGWESQYAWRNKRKVGQLSQLCDKLHFTLIFKSSEASAHWPLSILDGTKFMTANKQIRHWPLNCRHNLFYLSFSTHTILIPKPI